MRGHLSSYLEGFKKGNIKRTIDGSYEVYDPSLITDKNTVKRNIFGKIKGDKKRLALGFINKAFEGLSPYQEPSEEPLQKTNLATPTEKKKFTYGLESHLRRNIFKDSTESPEELEI